MRIRHITTGLYLGVKEDSNDLCLLGKEEANLAATCFYLREVKDDNKVILEDKDLEVIGVPNVRYDDVTVIAQHMETGYWLSYKASTVRKKGVGMVEEKRLLLHEEGRMDDGVEFARFALCLHLMRLSRNLIALKVLPHALHVNLLGVRTRKRELRGLSASVPLSSTHSLLALR